MFVSNFTIVWGFADHLRSSNYSGPTFDKTPQVQGLNCQPTFEKARARVIASVPDGQILAHEIIEDSVNATEAWTYPFIKHFYNASDYATYQNGSVSVNPRYKETVRYD